MPALAPAPTYQERPTTRPSRFPAKPLRREPAPPRLVGTIVPRLLNPAATPRAIELQPRLAYTPPTSSSTTSRGFKQYNRIGRPRKFIEKDLTTAIRWSARNFVKLRESQPTPTHSRPAGTPSPITRPLLTLPPTNAVRTRAGAKPPAGERGAEADLASPMPWAPQTGSSSHNSSARIHPASDQRGLCARTVAFSCFALLTVRAQPHPPADEFAATSPHPRADLRPPAQLPRLQRPAGSSPTKQPRRYRARRGLWHNVSAQLRNLTMPPTAIELTDNRPPPRSTWIDRDLQAHRRPLGRFRRRRTLRAPQTAVTIATTFRACSASLSDVSERFPQTASGGEASIPTAKLLYLPPILRRFLR